MNQTEFRMFAPWVQAATLPDGEIEAMSFEDCLAHALELGLRRFDRKTLALYCDIHYPHFGDLIVGRRPFPATKLDRFCMFTGCDYPRQWLAIQERKAIEEYRRLSQQAIGEFVQQAFGQRQAAA
ncbi:hypothetical protein POK33_12815 [Burkholderia cenocepacia]|uniref:hypothetical protein n=1 Tax=Burkholderia cenocepacia TaxID=95486 RepID=UPI0023B88FC7|nr:hypothetical protein [Burkholderia cenocepacia]MDF0501600.1 hypothetical protein [Burkholderia cenocepacia]